LAIQQRNTELREASAREQAAIDAYNLMKASGNTATADKDNAERELVTSKSKLQEAVRDQQAIAEQLRALRVELTAAEQEASRFRDIAAKTDNGKDQEMVKMQEEIKKMCQTNFNLTSTVALEAAQAVFTLANGTLKVIQDMLEKSKGESSGGRPNTIGAAPKKFAGNDLKKYAMWKMESSSYIAGQWSLFKDCGAVRLVLLSCLTADASEVPHMLMPENFTDDAQDSAAKAAALETMFLWLDGRFTDFMAQQRAREQLKNCRQMVSQEFQMWYLPYNKFLCKAGYVRDNHRTVSDFDHLYESLRPGVLKGEAIRAILIEGNSVHRLTEQAAKSDSQCARGSGGGTRTAEKSTPTAKEFQEIQKQLQAALEKTPDEKPKETSESSKSNSRTPRADGRRFNTVEEHNETAKGKPFPRGADCTYGEDCWFDHFGSHEGDTGPSQDGGIRTGKKRRNIIRKALGNAKFSLKMKGHSCYYPYSKTIEILFDSGSTDNLCSKQFVRKCGIMFDHNDQMKYEMMDRTMVETIGWVWWVMTIADREMTIEFAVLEDMGQEQVVLGYNWMRYHKVKLDLGEEKMTLGEKSVILRMSRSIQPESDNVLKRKMEKIKGMI
jgi:hypothetical protein